jgi:hypothetical protein
VLSDLYMHPTKAFLLFSAALGLLFQTTCNKSLISLLVIHLLHWRLTVSLIGSCSIGIVFQLSITYGGINVPAANTANITVTSVCLLPGVFMRTDFAHVLSAA